MTWPFSMCIKSKQKVLLCGVGFKVEQLNIQGLTVVKNVTIADYRKRFAHLSFSWSLHLEPLCCQYSFTSTGVGFGK